MTAAFPPAADPGDVPSETTLRHQAEGLAATMAALEANGPLSPVPYHTDAPLPSRRRRTRISRAHLHVVLSEPYRLWAMGEGPRPAAAEPLAA